MSDQQIDDETVALGHLLVGIMDVVEKSLLKGDGSQPGKRFLEADAVRIVDGKVKFHKGKFLALVKADVERVKNGERVLWD